MPERFSLGELLESAPGRVGETSLPVVSVSEPRGIVFQESLFKKRIATTDISRYWVVHPGNLVYNPYLLWNGAVGVWFGSTTACTSPAYEVLRAKAQGTERFIHYLMRSTRVTRAVNAIASGSVTRRRTAPIGRILALEFDLPSIDEQRRIAGVLGALDDIIEVNRGLARDCEQLAQSLAASSPTTTSLSTFTTWGGFSAVKPVGLVEHYSLPAFDAGRNAERVDGSSIKSNKQRIVDPCVLVARLNPHIPRVWMVYPESSVSSLASTEFVPISSNAVSNEAVYAVCSAPAFLEQMKGLVTGTTGSHQRVDKHALTSVEVPDVRTLSVEKLDAIALLVKQAHALRVEISELAKTRDELLPPLMSGRVRVTEPVVA